MNSVDGDKNAGPSAQGRFVVLDLGRARFGVEVDRVREVFATPDASQIPHAPEWVIGAIVRGGRLLTIVDLARLFGLTEGDGPHRAPTVCVHLDDGELSLAWAVGGVEVVEERDTVRSIDPKVVLPEPGWIADSLITPRFDFHRLDVARVLAGIRERF